MGKKLQRSDVCRVPENINFTAEEENVLQQWRDEKIFEKCSQLSKGKPKYTFYDGPPFATGLPHYGHILAGTIKDIVTRYAYQQGYHVDRRFGWDCHGLPVEFEIDKLLNIRGPEDVAKMGITAYNAECRKIVMRYADEWENVVTRVGRWIDFKNDYKTLYPWYMESIWWIFKQLFDKGLVYQGVKVMPYSTACTTSLSNFEANQNYKEVVDPCVVIALEALALPNTFFLVWTTTPWTLPSNFACCVHPTMTYVKVRDVKSDRLFILAESRLSYVFKTEAEYEVKEKFAGKTLKDLHYKPLFPYFTKRGAEVKAYRVLVDEYVTEDSGTGIVHNAPYFGEDDYRVCLAAGIITKSSEVICPVDDAGRFTKEASDFEGQYVKDADKHIMANLKASGNLVSSGQVKHSYPFCWRSDTPLIYKAVPSWFVRVEHMSKNLLDCSSQTYWVPDFVKEKRFGNWLKDARDWAISRNRYWGTPIPIWRSPNGEETVVIGSIKQLAELSGVLVEDLHRETIDNIEIPSAVPGNPPLRRIAPVFDCWFESGSMPFAQQHFPFENEKDFMNNFPADFIAEGIDQTRGWFYTLLVISTALFNKAPFKNLIASGLVLAADGQKMSKRKKNYPDPMEVVHKYGADALRLYLINSPVVRAESLRFKEEGVRDVIKDVFLPWYNAYRFLLQNIVRYEKEDLAGKGQYSYQRDRHLKNMDQASVIDVWILSFKESLLEFFATEMKMYRLYTVVPRLTKFIDQLTNWYVRLNRRRIKGELGSEQCIQSLDTLYDVLYTMVKMMAPFTPYLTEYIFQRLVLFQPPGSLEHGDSVHYQMMPVSQQKFIRNDIERSVALMQSVVELGRVMRDRRTLPVKYPVSEIIVIHKDEQTLAAIKSLQDFILSELNVRKLTLSSDKEKYGVTLRAEPDHKTLGQRLKGNFKAVMAAIKSLKDDEIQKQVAQGYFNILDQRIELEEVRIIYCTSEQVGGNFEAHSDNEVLVLLDMTPNEELLEEGLAREVINRVQKLKKKAQLIPTDPVLIYHELTPNTNGKKETLEAEGQLKKVLASYASMIKTAVKSEFAPYSANQAAKKRLIASELVDLKGVPLKLTICSTEELELPSLPWLNVTLVEELKPRFGKSNRASLLLQHNVTKELITLPTLRNELELLFGLYGVNYNIYVIDQQKKLSELKSIDIGLSGKLLVLARSAEAILTTSGYEVAAAPYSKFVNQPAGSTTFTENPTGHALA
ncbi:isoleucine--tRNA ligase, cytoplasmic [Drosophila persimilis]|uniref:isoleucine--tRNA ligase, cytoplasmic n=1 Tax=Drosophila persimilis TaxID=7234 RepID=UPI000F0784DF|nr:isoleucine--tRNA ligase, cytoplasmic [Drosophila persimilis]